MPRKSILFLSVLACIFLLAPARAFSSTFLLDRVVAVVNAQAITLGEIYRAMRFDYAPELQSLSGDQKRLFLKGKEAPYLDKMIDMALQVQEAQRQHMKVSDQEIDQAIDSIKQKYKMDDKTFSSALKSEGLTMDEYRQRLSRQMLVSEVVTREVRDELHVGSSQVEAYMKKNGLWTDNHSVFLKLDQVFFRMPEDPSRKAGIEKTAYEALKKIRSGADFMSVARVYSQAEPDVGIVKRDMLSGAMRSVLAGMKPGDVSKPFWTDQGLYILKLEDRVSSAQPGEKGVEEKVKKQLLEAAFQKAYESWLRRLKENAYVQVRL
ncbi:MAG: SurA N-terminal domain-containing protein [Nitrospiraceae bacterium]|nr:SurA N-terminal domain-containing protein [Nitrospiraceae bacterium]